MASIAMLNNQRVSLEDEVRHRKWPPLSFIRTLRGIIQTPQTPWVCFNTAGISHCMGNLKLGGPSIMQTWSRSTRNPMVNWSRPIFGNIHIAIAWGWCRDASIPICLTWYAHRQPVVNGRSGTETGCLGHNSHLTGSNCFYTCVSIHNLARGFIPISIIEVVSIIETTNEIHWVIICSPLYYYILLPMFFFGVTPYDSVWPGIPQEDKSWRTAKQPSMRRGFSDRTDPGWMGRIRGGHICWMKLQTNINQLPSGKQT